MILVSSFSFSQSRGDKVAIDSIQRLIDYSKKGKLGEMERFRFAKRANSIAESLGNDSISLQTNKNVVDYYLRAGDVDAFRLTTRRLIGLAKKLNDSIVLANAYYALGYSLSIQQQDSAYSYFNKAAKISDKLNNRTLLSFSLGSLASLQLDGKDYFGAEENAVRALKALDGIEETNDILDQKWILYNLLGNVANSLENYDKSIEYHYEAIEVAKEMDDDFNNGIYSLNNIAYVKGEQGLYDEAVKIYLDIYQRKNLSKEDPSFYALILENLAYSSFLTGTYDKDRIENLFEKSYAISDSIDDPITKTYATISMAKYYYGTGQSVKANTFAQDAYDLSKRLNSNEIYLESMKLLADLNEGEKGKTYLKEHIRVSDSLLNVERNVRNKYARIELETDKLEAENKQISKENLYLLILSIGLLLTAILIYIVISQRAKNRKLKLMQVQQKANEDIYNLMLGQQDKVDEARAKEKTRVSKELHDGVLGGLFGVRLSLDSINFQEGKEAMMTRAKYISQLQTIEQDIRKISHELNTDFVSGSSFIDIVKELIETQAQAYNLEYKFNFKDDINWDLVSNKTKINIYRIIQESMQNIYKHANANAIEISILLEKGLICLDIMDDGSGFDTSKSRKGIGLKNMRSRVDDINGSINFISQSRKGTTVNVKIPYTN